MEKGMVRCDVNVSVRPVGTKELGAKIEIKNMNSFSGVRRALEYEIPRQIEVREARRQAHPIHAPLGRRGRHHRGDAHQGGRARLPLFPRPRPDAARADGRVAGRGEVARGRAAAGAQAALHARLPVARRRRRDVQERRAAGRLFRRHRQAGEESQSRRQLGHQQPAGEDGRSERRRSRRSSRIRTAERLARRRSCYERWPT